MKTVFAALFATLLISPAFAADDKDRRDYQAKFNELDTDRSGTLSLEEAQAAGIDAETFRQADQDGDGVLSKDEFKAMKKDSKKEKHERGSYQ